MAKHLLHHYTFTPSTNTIVLEGIYGRERLLLITNAVDEQQVFVFNDGYSGLVSFTPDYDAETTTLVLKHDCSAMSATDRLQIFVEGDAQKFEPSPTYTDPVSKLRVSTPQNLIDTDFEYGLQSTKWETLELVKNIPSFFSRNGDLSLTLTSIAAVAGSTLITVTTEDPHNLSTANPLIVQGTSSISANGGYLVTKILTTTSFQYAAKQVQSTTGSLLDTYTQVFVASLYQGTEFQLSGINGLTTNGATPSVLTVETSTPTNFSVGTSFFLSNSVGGKELSFDAAAVNPSNVARAQAANYIDAATGELPDAGGTVATAGDVNSSGWALGAVQPHNWRPYISTFFISGTNPDATITVNLTTEVITLVAHGLVNNATYAYFSGFGNGLIGGLSDSRWYYAKVIDADNFTLSLTSNGTNVNLTSAGSSQGVVRSCFARVYLATSVNTTTEVVTMAEALPVAGSADVVNLAVYTTLGGVTVISSSALLTNYVIGGGQALHATAGAGLTYTFQSTFGGSNFNFSSATVAGAWMPCVYDSLANSIWFQSHGLATDDEVIFFGTSTLPSGTSTTYYRVDRLNANRVAFKLPNGGAAINMTTVGNSVAALKISEVTSTLNVAPTGETAADVGWQISSVCALNWLPDDATFFRAGTTDATVTINTTAETITFDAAHGLEDDKPYVYYAGYANTVIGGLTDGRWYYVRVVDATTIFLTLTAGSSAKVNLTNAGVDVKNSRSAFVRGYIPTAVDTSAETMTFAEVIPGAEAGGAQIYAAAYTTTGGLPIWSTSNTFLDNVPGNGTTVYAKAVSSDGKTLRFSNQINGATRDLNSATLGGVLIRLSVYAIGNSMYFANHRMQTGDLTRFSSNSTVPGGMINNNYYMVERVDNNRLKFQAYNVVAPVDLSNLGTSIPTAINYIFAERKGVYAYNDDGDYIQKVNHGLSDADVVAYNAGAGTPVYGLTSGNSYYVFNAKPNSFQLATTVTGYSGNAVSVTQTTSTMPFTLVNLPAGHGFVTGDRVQYRSDSPVGGLRNGAFYYVNVTSNSMRLFLTAVEAAENWEAGAVFGYPFSGIALFQKTTAVDLLAVGTGTQSFSVTSPGASDGVYTISSIGSGNQFNMTAAAQIPLRTVSFLAATSLWIQNNAIHLSDHYFVTGQDVVFTSTDAIAPLVNSTTYFVIRRSQDWIQLAATAQDAADGVAIALTSIPAGTQNLTTSSVTGELVGGGTISVDLAGTFVTGVATNFTSFFNTGDRISLYGPAEFDVKTVSTVNDTTDILTTTPAHNLTTEDMVEMDAAVAPVGTTNGQFYYVRVLTTTTLTLHPTPADALANTNIVNMSSIGSTVKLKYYVSLGTTTTSVISYVNSATTLQLTEGSPVSLVGANFTVSTSLLVRSDGFALHRPYDGGVELIPSSNPDSQMIRQTRRYFRYQSGKGIQVSTAVNFQPSSTIESYTASGTTATITTRYPHRLNVGLVVVVSGATTSGASNYWNGALTVASITGDFSYTVTLSGTPSPDASSGPGGIPEFYVQSWDNSSMRVGLFDDQNGLFFEFDGSELSVVRRNATTQISGAATVNFRSGQILGTATRFSTQLAVGQNIVIKGQTYLITQIDSNTSLFVLPFYRGESQTGVVITKVIDTKVPQSQWNVDKCDGTGPSGFYLRTYRIQMAYMDYSWYGAGKVRFGFKDQKGVVRYVHEFIHNNKQAEAYMRSGNLPGRYEIQNIGTPTYVPALAHWGTSVIMDGGFDTDSAYLFTASSNNVQLTGNATVAVTAVIETTQPYYVFVSGAWRFLGYALQIVTPSNIYNSLTNNLPISATAGLTTVTSTGLPNNTYGGQIPSQPYQVSLTTRIGNDQSTANTRNLLIINRAPSATAVSKVFTVTVAATAVPVVYDVPLISIRLAPSVDTNTPGFLGQREIINRMQLILQQVGILSTHSTEIILRLNGLVSTNSWERVTNPSLSQLIYHTNQDSITGGVDIFTFRAQGGTGTANRTAQVTTQSLQDITTLGNSILGGNNTFPDGPDVLTIVAKLSEDPSTVSTANPFNIVGRITWTESQA